MAQEIEVDIKEIKQHDFREREVKDRAKETTVSESSLLSYVLLFSIY